MKQVIEIKSTSAIIFPAYAKVIYIEGPEPEEGIDTYDYSVRIDDEDLPQLISFCEREQEIYELLDTENNFNMMRGNDGKLKNV